MNISAIVAIVIAALAVFAAVHFHLIAKIEAALHKHASAPSTAPVTVNVTAGNSGPSALPPASSVGTTGIADSTLGANTTVAIPAGFASAPNENGYVQLTQVEEDRAKYANDADPAYRYWAKTIPHWYAIDDTLKAFALSDAQRKKLVADLAQATVLLAMQGAGEWDFNVAANIPDSAAFSDGGFRPDIAGVHLRNLPEALAHQRAHVKSINPDGLDTVAPVAGPTHPGGGAGGPGHGAEAGK